MTLPSVPFKALTRAGQVVTISNQQYAPLLCGQAFPVMGTHPHGHGLARWRADGGWSMAPSPAHDWDLVAIVLDDRPTPRPITPWPDAPHPSDRVPNPQPVDINPAAAWPFGSITRNPQPFPNPQQEVAQPAAISQPEPQESVSMAKLINGFNVATLTETQAAIINNARSHSSDDERKQIKREVFAVVKAKYGIPESMKLSANTTGHTQCGYLVLHTGGTKDEKKAFSLGADGKWDGEFLSAQQLWPAPVQAGEGDGGDAWDAGDVGTEFGAQDSPQVAGSTSGAMGVAVGLPAGMTVSMVDSDTIIVKFGDGWEADADSRNDMVILTR